MRRGRKGWKGREGGMIRGARLGSVRASACSISGLGGNTSTNRVLFNFFPPLFFPFYALRAHRCRCIYSVWSVYIRRRGGRKTWREINRLSFARFLVHKIIKREVDGEINFTNPFYKKLGTRKFLLAASRKMRYEVNLRIAEGEENCAGLIDLS